MVTLNITEVKQKRTLLLHQAGQATHEILDTLPETGEEFATVMTKLNEYFSLKKNVDYQFQQAVQTAGKIVNQFATRLRKLAAHCEFSNLERELKSAITHNSTQNICEGLPFEKKPSHWTDC